MEGGDTGSYPQLGAPFLDVGHQAKRARRSANIRTEVYDYLVFVGTYLVPYAGIPPAKLASLGLPEPPPCPPLLDMLDRVDQYGLPNPGTWYDQPVDLLEDLDAVRAARWRYEREQAAEATQ
jgi:hypothetical protein